MLSRVAFDVHHDIARHISKPSLKNTNPVNIALTDRIFALLKTGQTGSDVMLVQGNVSARYEKESPRGFRVDNAQASGTGAIPRPRWRSHDEYRGGFALVGTER